MQWGTVGVGSEVRNWKSESLVGGQDFLSAVENGKKRMPSSWNNKLCRIYSLDTNAQESLTTAIADAEDEIKELAKKNLERLKGLN